MSSDEPDPGRTFELLEGGVGRRPLTARRAAAVISVVTVVLTLAGGLLIRVADPESFPTIGSGLWWAIQTLTTVGYGDLVPENALGKLIATIVMLNGIAFLTVVTAAVTASLIDQLRRRRAPGEPDAEEADAAVMKKLDEISGRLDEIEGAVGLRRQDRGP